MLIKSTKSWNNVIWDQKPKFLLGILEILLFVVKWGESGSNLIPKPI